MALTEEEIRANLTRFVARWSVKEGNEKREAQTYLTDFYNQVDDGAWADLRDLHREPDRAVVKAYGWPAQLADDALELKVRLATLHAEIEAGGAYDPFAG